MKIDTKDRLKGMVYGLAVGDALGAAVEFKSRGSFDPVTRYRTGTHGLIPGEWTDDTSMALALAESLKKGFDLADQLDRYCDWRSGDSRFSTRGCFDIGGQTSSALSGWKTSGRLPGWGGGASGNGSIMRLSPVAAKYHPLTRGGGHAPGYAALIDFCGLSSAATHANATCVTACRLLGGMLAMLVSGVQVEVLAQNPWQLFSVWRFPNVCPKVKHLWDNRKWQNARAVDVPNTGYVLDSLFAGLWALWNSHTFGQAVLLAANLGGDADTHGAVAGQLAGAAYGYSGIPDDMQDDLQGQELIEAAAGYLWGAGK